MINVYDSNIDGDKVKVFIAIEDGNKTTITVGNHAMSKKSGIQFYVDEHVSTQLDKLTFSMDGLNPKLALKEGEEIEEPQKTEKELRMEELQRELEELQNA